MPDRKDFARLHPLHGGQRHQKHATAANGGLREYRPEAAMFGPTSGTPVTQNADGSVTFVFKGGAPLSQVPTQETSVTVTKAGQVSVNYNRPL